MTEEEAKTKWCPMVKYDLGRSVNRDACYDNAGTHCVGSACMMWRSADIEMYCADPDMPEDGDDVGTEIVPSGYCGLAGKP